MGLVDWFLGGSDSGDVVLPVPLPTTPGDETVKKAAISYVEFNKGKLRQIDGTNKYVKRYQGYLDSMERATSWSSLTFLEMALDKWIAFEKKHIRDTLYFRERKMGKGT